MRHIPHPLTTPDDCAHHFALPPFDIQVILGGASGPRAPCRSAVRRDAATQMDGQLQSASHGQCRTAEIPGSTPAASHFPMTPRTPPGSPRQPASQPAGGFVRLSTARGPPQQAQGTQDRQLVRPRTPSWAIPGLLQWPPAWRSRRKSSASQAAPLRPTRGYSPNHCWSVVSRGARKLFQVFVVSR